MKNLKVLVMLFLAVSILGTACKKDDDDNDNPLSGSYKGSASLTIDGTTYSTLDSDVAEIEEGVVFLLQDADGVPFTISLVNLPAVGVTATLELNGDEDLPFILCANGPIPGVLALVSGSGTLKRTSEKDYEIDAILYGGMNFMDEYPIVGTVTVGVIDVK